jgi:hypothetical protein
MSKRKFGNINETGLLDCGNWFLLESGHTMVVNPSLVKLHRAHDLTMQPVTRKEEDYHDVGRLFTYTHLLLD